MQLVVTTDTTTLSYWLNWRVLLCAIWVLISIIVASFLIWKYEGRDRDHSKPNTQQDVARILYADEAWRPCIKQIHPIWLLLFRVIAFCLLLTTLTVKVHTKGFGMFYYYTQWTFTLVTIYFGLGSLLSIYGCYQYNKTSGGLSSHQVTIDAEQGSYTPILFGEATNMVSMQKVDPQEEIAALHIAGILGNIFQVIFQMSAGAVMLTDSLYWIVIFPFLTIKDYDLNFMTVNMHTLNPILLLGDASLNCLRFPWFRISYFFLWTALFVIFQWTIHACVSIWWPYPFLNLASTYAPLWYLLVAMMHIPCYGLFALFIKIKHYLLSKWFPQSLPVFEIESISDCFLQNEQLFVPHTSFSLIGRFNQRTPPVDHRLPVVLDNMVDIGIEETCLACSDKKRGRKKRVE